MSNTRLDSVLLAKAMFDYRKDAEKLAKYNLVPANHIDTLKSQGIISEDYEAREITPVEIAEAAEARAAEYGKDIKGYLRELEIAVERFKNHNPEDILKSNYKKYESYDIAAEAANSDDPWGTLLSQRSAV